MNYQRGFSLLEVVIAWGVASSMLLVLMISQRSCLEKTHTLLLRSEGVALLSSALLAFSHCSSAATFSAITHDLNRSVRGMLPEGKVSIRCQSHLCYGKIEWRVRSWFQWSACIRVESTKRI